MTRLHTCGWETGDLTEGGIVCAANTVLPTVVSGTPTPRVGTYCMKAITGTHVGRDFALASPVTDVWVRFGLYLHGVTSGIVVFANIFDNGGYNLSGDEHGYIYWTFTDGFLRADRGQPGAGTLLGAGTHVLAQNTWNTVEFRWQILTGSTGAVEIWLNGTRTVNFSGDTSNSAANLNIGAVRLANATTITGSGAYVAWDDVAINDTAGSVNNGRPGEGRIILLKPSGAGTTTTLSRGGTDTGVNYTQVNELPPSMTEYVYSSTVADRDLYALEDLPAGVSTVNVVEVLTYAQNSDSGAGTLGLTVKSGATTNEATAQSPSTTAQYIRQPYETDPATSAAWTVSAVNALEAGVTVR